MNGHSSSETLAFSMIEIGRQCGASIGERGDEPLFVFAASWGSGESELRQRVPWTLAIELVIEQGLLGAMAGQLVRAGAIARGDRISHAGGTREATADTFARFTPRGVAGAQAAFLRRVCGGEANGDCSQHWGFISADLTAEYALYLKLLFPRAKFIFLHRNPLDAFSDCIQRAHSLGAPTARDARLAAIFAEQWCRLVAGFQLWERDAAALTVAYDRLLAENPTEIEEYLGVPLRPSVPADVGTFNDRGSDFLDHDDVTLLVERTGDIAARCGYLLHREKSVAKGEDHERGAPRPAVHTEGIKVNCAVLVPTMRHVEPECEEALFDLERRGFAVKRMRGCALIDQARNILATRALEEGYEETMWIDSDTEFDPGAVDQLRSHGLAIF